MGFATLLVHYSVLPGHELMTDRILLQDIIYRHLFVFVFRSGATRGVLLSASDQ
jgi:hypothetical protein